CRASADARSDRSAQAWGDPRRCSTPRTRRAPGARTQASMQAPGALSRSARSSAWVLVSGSWSLAFVLLCPLPNPCTNASHGHRLRPQHALNRTCGCDGVVPAATGRGLSGGPTLETAPDKHTSLNTFPRRKQRLRRSHVGASAYG